MLIQNLIGEFNSDGEFIGAYRDLYAYPIPLTPELVTLARELERSAAAHKRVHDAKFSDRLRNEKLFNLEQESHNHG